MASASQLSNTLGAQVVFDGGIPRTFTGKATETISGGFIVAVSGADGDVGSQVSSVVTEDFNIIGAQTSTLANGIALNNAGSGETVTVATRGAYLMKTAGAIPAGTLVNHNSSGAVIAWKGSVSGTTAAQETFIGRALTTSASGTSKYALVSLLL